MCSGNNKIKSDILYLAANWLAFSHYTHLGLISLVCEVEKVHSASARVVEFL